MIAGFSSLAELEGYIDLVLLHPHLCIWMLSYFLAGRCCSGSECLLAGGVLPVSASVLPHGQRGAERGFPHRTPQSHHASD